MTTADDAPQWVTVAVLGRARGNRGELTALSLSSKPERYQELRKVFLFGSGQSYEVESTWYHGSTLIFKFVGVDSITDAEELVGCEVRIPVEERLQLDPDEFYHDDLIGCEVFDRATGESMGRVTAFDEGGGGSGLLVVAGDTLIPFVRSICREIDPPAKRIAVDLPPGLKDLNRA